MPGGTHIHASPPPITRHLIDTIAHWSGRHPWVVIGLGAVLVLVAVTAWWAPERIDPAPSPVPQSTTQATDHTTQLICADGRNTVLWEATGFSAADLEATDPARIGQLIGRCYVSIWEGTPLELPAGDEPVAIPEGVSTGNLPLISPPVVEAWRQSLDESTVLADLATTTWQDVLHAERVALPLAWLILVVATRSLFRSLIPLLAGAMAALLAAGLLGTMIEPNALTGLVTAVVSMIGLALGIDYALLTVLHRRTASHYPAATVAAAGLTVIGAASALLIVPVATLRQLATGVMIAAAVCVMLTVILVPALLAIVSARKHDQPVPPPAPDPVSTRIGPNLARLITVLLLGALVATAWQAQDLETGLTNPFLTFQDQTPAGSDRYDEYLQHEIIQARLSAVDVTIGGDTSTQAAGNLMVAIGNDADFAPIVLLERPGTSDTLTVRTLLIHTWGAEETTAALERLLEETIPAIADQTGANLTVSGPLVVYASTIETITTWQLRAGLLALSAATVILMVLQRSLVTAAFALGGSLLSFSAALGALALMTTGDTFIMAGPVEAWVPVVMFAIMLGLGVDYHLFLTHTARLRDRPGPAVFRFAAPGVVPVVVASALIMACVFGGFAFSRQPALQHLGIGLAVGVVLDAFVIRLLILPSLARTCTRSPG